MPRVTPEDLSRNQAFWDLNQDVLDGKTPGLPQPLKPRRKIETPEEKLLRLCTSYAQLRGYWPRTPEWINCANRSPKGWCIHLHKTKKNPIVLDHVLLAHSGRFLEIELKAGAPVTEEQGNILDKSPDCTALVYSLDEYSAAVRAWEEGE